MRSDGLEGARQTTFGRKAPAASDLYKAIALLFGFAVLFAYLEQIVQTFLLAYAAAILAVAFNAVVGLAPTHRKGLSALLGLAILASIAAGLWFGVPVLAEQARGLSQDLPLLYQQFEAWIQQLRGSTGLNVDLLGDRTREFVDGLFTDAEVIGTARGIVEALFVPLVLIAGGLFAAARPNGLLSPMLRAVPAGRRDDFARLFELLGERLIGWVKGTLVSFSIVAVLASLGLWLLGVPNALALGLLSGLSEFVPIFGAIVVGILVVGIAFLHDPGIALWAALLMLAIQQIDANLLLPMVMSKVAEVHPFLTLFSVILFGSMFGFLGVLLAVPLVLLVWTVVQVLWVERSIDAGDDPIPQLAEE